MRILYGTILAAAMSSWTTLFAVGDAAYDVAAYVWPAYQPEPRWAELEIFADGKGEWQNVYEAKPKWDGHRQPIVPLWGYENEADPNVVEKKIEAAVSHGVNVFIYDWYWYGGRPFLEDALDKGFLGAPNNGKMKFFVMWANHHVNNLWDNKAADKTSLKWRSWVDADEFRKISRRWMDMYFSRPNYYRICGKPVLMIYELGTFVEGLGGVDKAAAALGEFRAECDKAGYGGVHIMVCDYKLDPDMVRRLSVDSATIYNFVHWSRSFGNPDYSVWAENGARRFDAAKASLGVGMYFAHASAGWDTNPRWPAGSIQPTVLNSTPEKFEAALRRAKDWCDRNTPSGAPKLITVNSWNEWTEGSYLEPDTNFKFGYLEAVKRVFASAPPRAEVKVDLDKGVGPVKPVNGVGQLPMVGQLGNWSMMHYLKDAGIPYSRLHDVGGWLGHGLYVDIPNLFPDFEADENDPRSYRFAYTDSLMKTLEANGVEPFFRLGVSIENFAGRGLPPVNIVPPKDFVKWARIAEHVIRHYTEGWANGFKMKVTYWEIWNEPDNYPDQKDNCMWRGDWESYMRFYGTVAPYLKSKFPNLKIGGYGSCGFYAAVGSDNIPAANSSPRMEYFVDCARKFLAAARDNKWPLDFFSFHSYSDPKEAMRQVRFADELLNEYGFAAGRCERIFNEWLPYVKHENLGTALQAAGIAAELIGLQNGPCDLACIYDARCGVGNYAPLFNPLTYKPHKAYYAFTAFNELRRRGTAVAAQTSGDKDLWVAAAKGEEDAAVMIANDSDRTVPLSYDFQGRTVASCRITDKDRTDAEVQMPGELPPHSFILVKIGN